MAAILISISVITAFSVLFNGLVKTGGKEGSLITAGTKVVIDAGHGGIDGGVTGVKTGVKESELNLSVAKKLKDKLEDAGIEVIMTRRSASGLYGLPIGGFKKRDMQKREEIIEEASADVVISIHMNKCPYSYRRGAQVFYKKSSEQGKSLADSLQNSLNSMEEATRDFSPLAGDYFILNCSETPSVIVECGFLSNEEDEALLISDDYQEKLCYYIFKGLADYFAKES